MSELLAAETVIVTQWNAASLDRMVTTHASVSLPQAGGFSTSRVEGFHLDGLVSFGGAHVTVSGNEHSAPYWRCCRVPRS